MADLLGPAFGGGSIPLQPDDPGGDAGADLRREMARQAVEEGRALQRKRDLAAIEERRGRNDRLRLETLQAEARTYDALAGGFRTAQAGIRGFAGVLQQFASGNLLGGVLAASSAALGGVSALGRRWQGQADDKAQAKHAEDIAAGRAEKGSTAPRGFSAGAAALGAIGAAGSLVVEAFGAVAGAARTLFGTMLSFATAAAPGLGKTFQQLFDLVSAKIGERFVPALVDAAAWILTFSDTIAQVVGDIIEAVAGFVQGMGKWVAGRLDPTGGMGGAMTKSMYDSLDDEQKKKARIRARQLADGRFDDETDPAAEAGKRRNSFQQNRTTILRTMMQNSGGPPGMEQGDQTWKRLQMAELGMSDIQKQQLDIQRRILAWAEGELASGKMAEAAAKAIADAMAKPLAGVFGF
jgi:hypothetical protein